MTIIRDPSTGNGMAVSRKFRASVDAVVASIQNFVSLTEQQAYIVGGQTSWVADTGEQSILFIENTSSDLQMVLTRAVVYVITDLTLPDTGSFFSTSVGGEYNAGGSLVIPTNEHVGSPNVASVLAYDNNPTIVGATSQAIIHPAASGQLLITGTSTAQIIEPTQSIQSSFTPAASHTGTAFIRVEFYMAEP